MLTRSCLLSFYAKVKSKNEKVKTGKEPFE